MALTEEDKALAKEMEDMMKIVGGYNVEDLEGIQNHLDSEEDISIDFEKDYSDMYEGLSVKKVEGGFSAQSVGKSITDGNDLRRAIADMLES